MAKKEPVDLLSKVKKTGTKFVDRSIGVAKKGIAGLKSTIHDRTILGHAKRAAKPLMSGTLMGPAIVAAPAITETARAIGDVSGARSEGVPVSRGLAFRRHLEAMPGAMMDAGATIAGGVVGIPAGPGGMAAGALAGAALSKAGRRSMDHNVNVALDKMFGTDLSTNSDSYSATGRIKEARERQLRATDLKFLQDEGLAPGPRREGLEGKITGLGELDTAIAGSTGLGNTLSAPAVQTARPAEAASRSKHPDVRVRAITAVLDMGARAAARNNALRQNAAETARISADTARLTAETGAAAERRQAASAGIDKRAAAQLSLDKHVETLVPDVNERAGFAEFLGAMNPTALVDEGLLTKEQADSGRDFEEMLVNLRMRDPQSASKVLGSMLPLYRAFKQIKGGSGQGLANPVSEGVPGFFDALSPGGVTPGEAIGARARSMLGGGEFVQFDDGGQLDKRELVGQGKAGAFVARGLRKAAQERALIDDAERRKLAIAGAQQREVERQLGQR